MEDTTMIAAPETTGGAEQLIIIKQLPIIQEQLYMIKSRVEEIVTEALAMEVTKETVETIKKKRAGLNKMLTAFEERRKEVKKAVLSPYDTFEAVYRECVSDPFKTADAELKNRIAFVEDGVKDAKRAETAAYFAEYAESLGIDFVEFEDMHAKVTLSDSLKKLKATAKEWLDSIASGMKMISTFQEHAEEIMTEFKQNGYNASAAVVAVSNRHKAIERERQLAEERRQREAERAKREAELRAEIEEQRKAEAVAQAAQECVPTAFAAPVEQTPVEEGNGVIVEPDAPAEMLSATFTVYGTIDQLKAVKNFLIDGGYRYEC